MPVGVVLTDESRKMKQILGFLVAVVGILGAMPAGATQWTSSSGVSSAGDEYTITVGGQSVLVRAYSTKTTAGGQSGTFSSAAEVKVFSEGFGVDNKGGPSGTQDGGEASFPEWGVDNAGLYDLLVFELPNAGMTLEGLGLGWAEDAAGTDISVFFGGNALGAGYNFSNACFTGCANSGSGASAIGLLTSTNLGFTRVDLDNVAVGSPINPGIVAKGQYLAVSGSLLPPPHSQGDDKFKVNMIKASKAPLPGTLALLGLGLVGLGYTRRLAVKV